MYGSLTYDQVKRQNYLSNDTLPSEDVIDKIKIPDSSQMTKSLTEVQFVGGNPATIQYNTPLFTTKEELLQFLKDNNLTESNWLEYWYWYLIAAAVGFGIGWLIFK